MNYDMHYTVLMTKARARQKPDGYVERHHVQPRSLGGSNKKENLVWLTAKEHFVAHVLLAKIYGGSQWYAVMMFAANERRVVNSRLYEAAKAKHAKWMSVTFLGSKRSAEHRAAISAGMMGNKNTAGKPLSESHRKAISRGLVGNKNTAGKKAGEETKQKMSIAHAGEKHHYYGKSRDERTRQKIREKLKGVKRGPRSEAVKEKIRQAVLAAIARKKQEMTPSIKRA